MSEGRSIVIVRKLFALAEQSMAALTQSRSTHDPRKPGPRYRPEGPRRSGQRSAQPAPAYPQNTTSKPTAGQNTENVSTRLSKLSLTESWFLGYSVGDFVCPGAPDAAAGGVLDRMDPWKCSTKSLCPRTRSGPKLLSVGGLRPRLQALGTGNLGCS